MSIKSIMCTARSAHWILAILILAMLSNPGSARAQQANTKDEIYVVNHVDVTGDHAEEASKLLQQYAADTRKDPGALRVEAAVQLSRPNHFVVIEVWKNKQAYDAHTDAAHTKQFREKVQPMLGSPFDERLHQIIG
jgi:quinol monooxygenase YgiN